MNSSFQKNLIGLIFIVFVFVVGGTSGRAEEHHLVSTEQMLEQSLSSLRDGTKRLTERNQWLAVQIQNSMRTIPRLEDEIAQAERDNERLQNEAQGVTRRLSKTAEDLNAAVRMRTKMMTDSDQFVHEAQNLEEQLAAKEKEREEMETKIHETEDAVNSLRAEQKRLSIEIKSGFSQAKGEIVAQINENRRELEQGKRDLQELENKGGSGLAQWKMLWERRNQLQQKEALLQNELKTLSEETTQLKKDSDTLENQRAEAQKTTGKDIAALQKHRDELKGILVKAKSKLNNKKIMLASQGDPAGLDKSVQILRQENEKLKDRLSKMEAEKEFHPAK